MPNTFTKEVNKIALNDNDDKKTINRFNRAICI